MAHQCYKFWKDGLNYSNEDLAKKDGVLFLKVLFLFETAVQARKALSLEPSSSDHAGVFFALENPQDPELVGQKFSQIGCSVMCREDVAETSHSSLASPTFFAWPEVRSFRTRYNLLAAHCDQGALGHYLVKPTTVLTSDLQLWESLEQVQVRVPWVVSVPKEADQRLAISKSCSLWASGLTTRIKRCLRAWLAHSSFAEHQAVSEERAVHLAKLTAEEAEYRDHCFEGVTFLSVKIVRSALGLQVKIAVTFDKNMAALILFRWTWVVLGRRVKICIKRNVMC